MIGKDLREIRRAKKKRQKTTTTIYWIGAVIVALGFMGFLIWRSVRPAAGVAVPIMTNSADHVQEGENPGPYNSDPPTSGPHYDGEFDAGFYDESSPETQLPYPEGYIGHNLEHGYVIYWYNCELLDDRECEDLKQEIKDSIADNGNIKLIAFPRKSLSVPIAMTRWGQLLEMQSFDAGEAKRFVSVNRNRAPEPNAP